jgi:hypothetical protein
MNMGGLRGILSAFSSRSVTKSDIASGYIFYKIVNLIDKKYLLQCINTKATFLAGINDIVADEDILYGLHPIQACYIGIEYATSKSNQSLSIVTNKNAYENSSCRYGTLSLRYQNRKKNLGFIELHTRKEFVMDPRDIALTEQLISAFDSIQAFYIGISAGLKMNNPVFSYKENTKTKLTLIK